MIAKEFSQGYHEPVDVDTPLSSDIRVQRVDYRGPHKRDRVRTVRHIPEDSTVRSLADADTSGRLIGFRTSGRGRHRRAIEPTSVFVNGHTERNSKRDSEFEVVVPITRTESVTRRLGPHDKIIFPTHRI